MTHKKKVRILSLDGGGIRGIIPALVIQYAEAYLQKKAPGTTIADHFDFIAGTSTGGILTGIYLAPQSGTNHKARYTATEALNFYVTEGYKIFNDSKIPAWKRLWGLLNATEYSPKHLDKILADNFGELMVSDLIKPCLIPTYNINTKSSFFFTSMEDTARREFLVRDALRSTSAAPTYFPPTSVKNRASKADPEEINMLNVDGGVFANNPLLCAYAEARNTNFKTRNNNEPLASDMYILSLGTGAGEFKLRKTRKSGSWGLIKWAKSIPEIMMDGAVDTIAYQMKEIFETLLPSDLGAYMRVDVPRIARQYDSDMANATPDNIRKLVEAGKKTVAEAKTNGLDAFLDGLLDLE